MQILLRLLITLFVFVVVSVVRAETWMLPPEDIDIIGQMRSTQAGRADTLLDIARQYDIGQTEIVLANPDVDRWMPEDGSEVILPSRHLLPQVERKGLVLNLPEMRLYYFPEPDKGKKPVVMTFPTGIGRMDWETPLGISKIIEKKKDPAWAPPESIKKHRIANGEPPLPDVVPPGPDNPLGRYAIRLSIGNGSYLIHGTIKPFGVGMRVSSGCVRLYPEDIEKLYNNIETGVQVNIINQPIKLGWLLDSLFIELHPPLEEDEANYTEYKQIVFDAVNAFLAEKGRDSNLPADFKINQSILEQAIKKKTGIPVLISQRAAPSI